MIIFKMSMVSRSLFAGGIPDRGFGFGYQICSGHLQDFRNLQEDHDIRALDSTLYQADE
jgi:hypothetical protein